MNIFNRVALQGLKKNRTRTLVTIVGVLLSAALFTGVATFAVSLQSYLINSAAVKYGSWHLELPAVSATIAADAADDSRVADTVLLQNIGYAALEGGKNPAKPYIFLSGWDKKALEMLPVNLLSGRLPENGSEVVVPAHLAANGGVKFSIGETITLSVGNRINGNESLSQHNPYVAGAEILEPVMQKSYTVVGICQRPTVEEYSAPGYTLITAADNSSADDVALFITLKNPYQLASYTKDVVGDGSYVLNDNVLRFMGLSSEKLMMVLLYAIVAILVILVVVGSVFLIYNAFSISLNERTQQFGILMSVGATEKQLRNSVLFEGLCIGMIGIPLGILVGLPGVQLVLSLVEKNFANVMYDTVPLSLVVSVPAIVAAAIISFFTIFISAYIPAKKAAAMPVMDCIRQTKEIKLTAENFKISPLVQRFLGLAEQLALKNFKRNKRRYGSIILSLTFSMVLFVGASSFGSYLNQIADASDTVVEQYDIVFSSSDMEETELLQLYDQLKSTAGITVSGYQAEVAYPCCISAEQLSSSFLNTFGDFLDYDGKGQPAKATLDAVFVDDNAYQKLLERLNLPANVYNGQADSMILAAYVEGYLYWQDIPIDITLCDNSGNGVKTVRATFVKDYPDLLPAEAGSTFRGYSLLLIAPYTMKAQFDGLDTVEKTVLGMTFESDNPGQSTAQMQTILDANGITAEYSLYNLYAILEQNRNLNFIVHLFAAVFVLMITLIAVANVFNTISTNVKLRRRELAMLRSVGMAERDFNRMLCFECILYGARTMLWGLPLSVVSSWLIYRGMVAGGGFQLQFLFPWSSLVLSALGVFLVVLITMLYATRKIKKENIIDGLRDELT